MKTSQYFILFFLLTISVQAQWSNDPNNNLIVGYGLDPHICSDSAGGCYITYDYNSTSYPRWLALERLNKYGYKPWGTLKRILGELPGQSNAQIVEDGEGGVIVSYKDRFENLPSWTQNIRVQRVDSSGNFLWGQAGVRVTLDEINQSLQQVVADGSGGCVVTWKTVSYTFYVNRISANGERMWSDSGILLGISNYSGTEPRVIRATDGCFYVETGEYIYRIRESGEIVRRDSVTLGYIVPDNEGGIVLSGRVWTGMIPKLVAHRKDSLGNNLWQEPYVEVADSLHINTTLSIVQYREYYFYGWMGKKNGNNEILQIQGLRNNGTLLFNQGSIALSNNPGNTTYVPIVTSDSGSCIFISSYANGTFGQKIDTLGLLRWNSDQVLLNYPHIGLDHSFVTTDCVGGVTGLGVYLTDFAIPVFKVSSKGNLGEIITNMDEREEKKIPNATILYQNYPNPFNSTTYIKYQVHREGRIRVALYNVLGEKLKILTDELYTIGTYSLRFNSEELPSGIYLYALESGSEVIVKKLIILK